jgi:hypothetical protein
MVRRFYGSRSDQCAFAASLLLVLKVLICATRCGANEIDQGAAASPLPVATATLSQNQLWLVNCRGADYQADDALAGLTYAVYRPGAGWTNSDKAQFEHGGSPSLGTCVLVFGNGYTAADTRGLGHMVYKRLTAGLPIETRVRFVIWSWPSDHADAGPIKDLRIKAARTTKVAWRLAHWMEGASSDRRLSLLGTSFGARIVLEALELRGGGQLGHLRLENPSHVAREKVNVVLVSAALDNDWLLPGHRLDGAVTQIERLLLVNNTSDSVLKRYHWLYGSRSKAAALGSTGLRMPWAVGALGERLMQIDAAPIIGRRHGCAPYFESPRLLAAMREVLFHGDDPSPQIPADGLKIPIASNAAQAPGRD